MIGVITTIVRLIGMAWANPLLLVVPLGGLAALTGWHVVHERNARHNDMLAAYAEGSRKERTAWEQAVSAEMTRQKEVGAAALAEAKAEINRLEAENAALAAASKEWDREADSAPDAGDVCLSPGSRLRLNKQR